MPWAFGLGDDGVGCCCSCCWACCCRKKRVEVKVLRAEAVSKVLERWGRCCRDERKCEISEMVWLCRFGMLAAIEMAQARDVRVTEKAHPALWNVSVDMRSRKRAVFQAFAKLGRIGACLILMAGCLQG